MSIFIDNLRSKTENQIEVDKKRKERESIIASEIKKRPSYDVHDIVKSKSHKFTENYMNLERAEEVVNDMLSYFNVFSFKNNIDPFIKTMTQKSPDHYSYEKTAQFLNDFATELITNNEKLKHVKLPKR
jgi:phage gp29-like protein|tara:strand:+ start:466 stop:852 length:387 start_codon:yes stop_codon:yes gene_type:complete